MTSVFCCVLGYVAALGCSMHRSVSIPSAACCRPLC